MHKLSVSTIAAAGMVLAAVAGASPAGAVVAKTVYATGVTAPAGAVWLKDATTFPGTTTPTGGHLWVSDHLNGLCRLDQANAAATTATLNTSSCLVFGATTQVAFDAAAKWLYVADISHLALGVKKIAFNPTTGLLNKLKQSTLSAPVAGLRLTAVGVDSKGNVYVGEKRGGGIYKYPVSATRASGALNTPQQVGSTEDGGGVLNFAFGTSAVAGTTAKADDLYVAGVNSALLMPDVNGVDPSGIGACSSASPCTAFDPGFGIFTPKSVAWDGTYAYAGDVTTLHRINPADLSVTDYATGFANLSAIAVIPAGLGITRKVFGADDPSAGAANLQGHVYRMNRQQ